MSHYRLLRRPVDTDQIIKELNAIGKAQCAAGVVDIVDFIAIELNVPHSTALKIKSDHDEALELALTPDAIVKLVEERLAEVTSDPQ